MKTPLALTLAIALLAAIPSWGAEVLRANLPVAIFKPPGVWETHPLSVTIRVNAGKIRSIALLMPPIAIPPPDQIFYFSGDPYVHEGVPGYVNEVDYKSELVANSSIRFLGLTKTGAREIQTDSKRFFREGIATYFTLDEGDTGWILVGLDSTPYEATYSGTKASRAELITDILDEKTLHLQFRSREGAILKGPLGLFDITMVDLRLTPGRRGKWKLELSAMRRVSHNDYWSTALYSGNDRMRGRAKIDFDQHLIDSKSDRRRVPARLGDHFQ